MSRADDDGADVLGCACGAQGEATRLRAELEARTRERDDERHESAIHWDMGLTCLRRAKRAEAELADMKAAGEHDCLQRHKDAQTEWGRLNAELATAKKALADAAHAATLNGVCFVCRIEDTLGQKRFTQSHPIQCVENWFRKQAEWDAERKRLADALTAARECMEADLMAIHASSLLLAKYHDGGRPSLVQVRVRLTMNDRAMDEIRRLKETV